MSSPIAQNPIQEQGRRQWERLPYDVEIILTLEDGREFRGTSLDVSKGGIFLITGTQNNSDLVGLKGNVFVQQSHDPFSIACIIVRATDQGIGINFCEDHTSFGMFITHDMTLKLLNDINDSFATSLDLDTTIKTSVTNIKDFMRSEAASLFLVSEDEKTVKCHACVGPVDIQGLTLDINEGIVGRAIREGKAVIVEDTSLDPDFAAKVDEATGFETLSILCSPLKIQNRTIGALQVINKTDGRSFIGHDRILLSTLAPAAAMAIHNAKQVKLMMAQEQHHKADLERQLEERTRELRERNQELLAAKERAEDAVRSKDQMISLVSHDLRGPLGTISGLTDILCKPQTPPLAPKSAKSLSLISATSKDLLNLVDELLDIARLQSGKITPDKTRIEAHGLVDDIITRLSLQADGKSISLINDVPKGVELCVDRVLFAQVIQNLLSNAIKFSWPESSVCIFMPDGDNTTIAISDQGVGIDADLKDKLFDLGEKASHTGTRGESGNGFGLPLCAVIMQAHGGRLDVVSEPDKGSTFYARLL